jgi:hypothetical protein
MTYNEIERLAEEFSTRSIKSITHLAHALTATECAIFVTIMKDKYKTSVII